MRSLRQFWSTDRGLSVLLAILVVTVFVLPPLVPGRAPSRRLFDVFFSALLVIGAYGITGKRTRIAVSAIALAAVLVRWASSIVVSDGLERWAAVSWVASAGLLSLVVLAQVMASGPVTMHRILGAIAVYLLLGLTWAGAYNLVALLDPGAFSSPEPSLGDLLYYSFVTLTTVGYGDITPVTQAARSLAMLEALIGQLYPAILLARLVSLQLQSPSAGGKSETPGSR